MVQGVLRGGRRAWPVMGICLVWDERGVEREGETDLGWRIFGVDQTE